MALNSEVASVLLEQIQDYHQRPSARFIPEDSGSYSTMFHEKRREVRRWVDSYIFDVDGDTIRVDVLDGKVVKWLSGGSTRAMTFIAQRVSL